MYANSNNNINEVRNFTYNQVFHLFNSRHFASTIDDNDEGYWREVKAIIGGVLGFWGGIGSLGTLFLVVVMSKRYCCREVDDKENDKDG